MLEDDKTTQDGKVTVLGVEVEKWKQMDGSLPSLSLMPVMDHIVSFLSQIKNLTIGYISLLIFECFLILQTALGYSNVFRHTAQW